MGFLPQGYTAPEAQSNYLKPKKGAVKFRAVGEAITGFEWWIEEGGKKKPVRSTTAPTSKPENIRINDDGSYTVKHFWAFPAIDRADLGGVIKIMEITQASVMRMLEDYMLNSDWGDITEYDITITGKGEGMSREYTVIASPLKPLTKKEVKLIEKTKVNVKALLYGADPFDEKWTEPTPDELPNTEIPF